MGKPLVVIHCASLQTILRAALDGTLHLGADCVAVTQDDHAAAVVLRHGRRHRTDVVIGGDGDRSENPAAVAIRNAVLPAARTDGLGWLAPVVGHETPTSRS